MADTTTALGLVKIEVGASNNTWGTKINDNMDRLQDLFDGTTAITPQITGGTISGITDLAVADGGTGASNASGARTNLGLVIGTNVQAWDADLDAIAALAKTDGNFIVGNGTTWVAESGSTARTSLGLGSIATQDASSVAITGGSITGLTTLEMPVGTVSAPGLAFDGDTNTGIYSPAQNEMDLVTFGVSQVHIDTTAITASLPIYAALGTTTVPSIAYSADTNTGFSFTGSDRILFLTGGNELARMNTSAMLIGQIALSNPGVGGTTEGASITSDGRIHASVDGNYSLSVNRNTSDGTAVTIRRDATQVGTISVTGSATAYNTSSDYRLKDALPWDAGFDALEVVKALADAQRFYAWKDSGQTELGWFAHELQAIAPEAVTGEKDGAEMQGRDDAKLVKYLVAAVAELTRRLEAL